MHYRELLNSPTCLGDLGAADMTSFPPKDDALMQVGNVCVCCLGFLAFTL